MPNATVNENGIVIDESLDDNNFQRGIANTRKSIAKLKQALGTAAAGGVDLAVKGINKLKSGISALGNLLKKVLIGGLLLFGASVATLFRGLGETFANMLQNNLKGTQLAKDVEGIKNKFTELKFSIAAAFLPIVQAAIPYIQRFIEWLIKAFNFVGMVTAAFMGQKQVLQVIPGSAEKLAKATEKTKKAAQGALAAFDQINVLTQPQEPAAEAGALAPQVATQMVPVTDDILKKVQALKDLWAKLWTDPLSLLKSAWGMFTEWFKATVIDPIKQWWAGIWAKNQDSTLVKLALGFQKFVQDILNWIFKLGTGALNFIFETGTGILNWIFSTGQGVLNFLATGLVPLIVAAWTAIKENALTAWTAIQLIWTGASAWIDVNFLSPLVEGFKGALSFIKTAWTSTFTGIRDFLKGTVNGIIDLINGLVTSISTGVNTIINGINSVGSLTPGFVAMPTVSVPRIPHLATGALVPPHANMLAMIGEGSKSEIVAPDDKIRQIIREELGSTGNDVTVPIVLQLDGETVYRNQQRVSRRRGSSLITGGTV